MERYPRISIPPIEPNHANVARIYCYQPLDDYQFMILLLHHPHLQSHSRIAAYQRILLNGPHHKRGSSTENGQNLGAYTETALTESTTPPYGHFIPFSRTWTVTQMPVWRS
ncbi:hypothetical protein Tco_1020163 [Tanacetum coccineum]|uniref:Uncharacterized protein n=1 Tax=Tanacetum coccineum TaxID=301880 RepID=A0ABQ5FZ94_9ASTR